MTVYDDSVGWGFYIFKEICITDPNILLSAQVNEEVRELQKKLAQVEEDNIRTKAALEQANKDLEEKEKTLAATEAEVAALNRKVQQIEEDLEKSEERSGTAQQKLLEAQQSADENNR